MQKYGLTHGISLCPSGDRSKVTDGGETTWWGYFKLIGYQYIGGAYNGLYNWAYHNNVSVNQGASGAVHSGWLQLPHEFTPTPDHIFRTRCLGQTL